MAVVVVSVPGANTFKKDWMPWFRARDVRVVFDNDKAGAHGELKVAGRLSGVVASLEFFQWGSNDEHGMDVRDLIVKEFTNEG